jgi:hypothetical protein
MGAPNEAPGTWWASGLGFTPVTLLNIAFHVAERQRCHFLPANFYDLPHS